MDRREAFRQRLSQLRIEKNISSRDMSLSLGLSPAYINNIENGVSLPSMDNFFLICDFFEITPAEFFDFKTLPSLELLELYRKEAKLSPAQVVLLSSLVDEILAKN